VRIGLVFFLAVRASSSQTFEVVHAFRNSGQPAPPDEQTQSALIQGSDGSLYGTSYWGGTNGVGTIFRIDSGGTVNTVHSFAYADGANPAAGLVEGTDGNYYGTATRGGASNLGTVFRMDPSGMVTRLHSFDGADGEDPRAAVIQGSDGMFYGTTNAGGLNGVGTVFRMDASGGFEGLHSFDRDVDGAYPAGALLEALNGGFYGTTTKGGANQLGTVFKIDSSGGLTTVHDFEGPDGAGPYAAVIQAGDGSLYGTTVEGGANLVGTIFRIDGTGTFATLHSFDPSAGEGSRPYAALVSSGDGEFEGTASQGSDALEPGAIYRITSSGEYAVLHRFDGTDGWSPGTALVHAQDGDFYGTTTTATQCVLNQCFPVPGSVYRMDSSGAVSRLHSFGWGDGAGPASTLIQATNGSLYATTVHGGTHDFGSVFRRDPSGSVTTLHSFDGTDGAFPRRVIQSSDGMFYGSTGAGGANDVGTFFRMDPNGAVTALHAFASANGSPSDLMQAFDGAFYGTTLGGGAGWGSAFRLDASGGFTELWSFEPAVDGAFPSSLVQASSGLFYGTTYQGGPNDGVGTIFAMTTEGTVFSMHSFQGPDGRYPVAGVIEADQELFGTTLDGGDGGFGTVFAATANGDLSVIHSFQGDDGAEPQAPLLKAQDGLLYGTAATVGGVNGKGVVFRWDVQGEFVVLHRFGGIDGSFPSSGLVQTTGGDLYGMAGGGPFGEGIIYRLSPSEVAVGEVAPRSGPASGGTALDVLGGGFATGASVTVGGAPGTDVTALDPTFLYLLTPALQPGTLNDVSVCNPGASCSAAYPGAYFVDFLDVPQSDPFHDFIEMIFRRGITAGCTAGQYCPDLSVTRAQMAAFLLKAEHGSAYLPPSCTGLFDDVACPSLFADWIEQLAAEGITAGCGVSAFCPASPVTRAQMAVFLLKTEHGPIYTPPPCGNLFLDVACPSLFADWIEQLAAENVTGGCGGGNYCPGSPNTRGQMAVFLTKAFHLQ
jgi:uncharacterized repeat protein (TIGR03803 family)